jgi:hypothetical protein
VYREGIAAVKVIGGDVDQLVEWEEGDRERSRGEARAGWSS